MASWYQKVIIPRFLTSVMASEDLLEIRRDVLAEASGVVLEIGVGPGYNLPLYQNISKLYALEPSKELIDIATRRAGSLSFPLEFLQTGAEHIPLSDHSVDTVVSTWSLCSVSDPRKVLTEIARVLRPSGKFLFVDHGASPNTFLRVLQTILTTVTKHFTGNCHLDRPLEKMMRESGFEIEKMEHPRRRHKLFLYHYQGQARIGNVLPVL